MTISLLIEEAITIMRTGGRFTIISLKGLLSQLNHYNLFRC